MPIIVQTGGVRAGINRAKDRARVRSRSDDGSTISRDSQEDIAEGLQHEMRGVGGAVLGAMDNLAKLDDAGEDVLRCGPLNPIHLWCLSVERSALFSALVASVIICNVGTMMFEVDYPNFDLSKDCPMHCMEALSFNTSVLHGCDGGCMGASSFWTTINHSFLVFFTIELVIRIFAAGGILTFFCNTDGDQGWNIFDFAIVSTCFVLWYCSTAKIENGKYFNLLRSLRMLRMLRVLRIFRIALFKKLNIIVQGLIESIPSGFWIGCMLSGVIFVSAIFCTDLLGHQADNWPEEDRDDMKHWFGSMGRSMATLFQFLTLADWSSITRVVAKENGLMLYFFVGYVIFAAMVILSLLTGVLADHINSVTTEAEEDERVEKESFRKEAVTAEFKAFRKIMRREDGRVHNSMTFEQFREVLADEEIVKSLEELGIEEVDQFEVEDLFLCFDRSASKTLSFHEFSQGMEELRIGVTGKQVFKLEVALRNAVHRCRREAEDGEDPLEAKVREQLKQAQKRVDGIEYMMNELIQDLDSYKFIPPAACCDAENDGYH